MLGAVAATVGLTSRGVAFDAQLDADTSFQAYEVRSVGARAFHARRRLLSRLALTVSHELTEPDDEGRVVRIDEYLDGQAARPLFTEAPAGVT